MQRAVFDSKNARNTRAQIAEAGKIQGMLLAENTGAQRAEAGKTQTTLFMSSSNKKKHGICVVHKILASQTLVNTNELLIAT